MNSVKKCPSEEMLLKLAENELDEHQASFIKAHVLTCERCQTLGLEYRETLFVLAGDRISEPSPSEWQQLMATVRTRIKRGARVKNRFALTERPGKERHAWSVWIKGTAIAATAVVALLVLWNAGVVDVGRLAGGIRHAATRNQEALTRGENHPSDGKPSTVGEGRLAEGTTAPDQKPLSEEAEMLLSDRVLWEPDSTFVSLADLTDEELYELSQLSTSVRALEDYNLLLVDLTEEEQAELLKGLENSSSM